MAKFVISTLGADTQYNDYTKAGGVNSLVRSVFVKGGAGVAGDLRLLGVAGAGQAPRGVKTQVSEEDAAFLANHGIFKEHQERGFVKIINADRDPNTVAQSMSVDEGSRPRTDSDVEKFNKAKGANAEADSQIKATTNAGKRK